MISRHRMILKEIIANYFGASEEELCSMGEITTKTFKSDIQTLEKALSKYHLSILNEDNRYYIPFDQKEEYLNVYEELIKEGEELFVQGHTAHAQLITEEANGNKTEVQLLLVHAEDQLMSAEAFGILAKEFVELYKKVNK